MEMNFSKLYFEMEEPIVKLFRERKYPLHIDTLVDQAIARSNCEKRNKKGGTRRYKDNEQIEKLLKRKETKLLKFERDSDDMIRKKKDGTKKRDTRHWYDREQNDRRVPDDRENELRRRSDIPIVHADCDDMIAKGINDLYAIIKQLRDDVGKQTAEIQHLRHLIENCAGCQDQPQPTQPPRDSCAYSNPCYHGVQCHDTSSGPRCGSCPRGYVGDGMSCKPGYTCAERPCYRYVFIIFVFIYFLFRNPLIV